jgi:signal transduction histidine kinase
MGHGISIKKQHCYRRVTGNEPTESIKNRTTSPEGELIGLQGCVNDISHRRQEAENEKKNALELEKRLKELNCLYEILTHVEKQNNSLQDTLEGILGCISKAFQFVDDTCARILLESAEYRTENFKKTRWCLKKEIHARDKNIGSLEVYYLEERPAADEGPFLKEERRLIDAIAGRLGRIIESKLNTQALLDSEKRFRKLVEDLPIGISILQGDKSVYRNPKQRKLLGNVPINYWPTAEEILHPEDLEKMHAFYQRIVTRQIEKETIDFRIFLPDSDADGAVSMKRISCCTSKIDYEGKESLLMSWSDTTETMKYENLMQVQDKMASLGRVTAGIAHEIRNPLSGINIYLSTLEGLCRKKDSLETIEKIIGEMKTASERIESVINKTMDFAKPSDPVFALISLNESIADAVEMTSVLLRKNHIVPEIHLCEDMPPCRADRRMFSQVILNLIANASDAMKNTSAPKKLAITSALLEESIEINVADSGLGVPEHLRQKVFEPFFSDKQDGTGIGLSLSRRIVTDHGGTLRVTSSEWNGAKFIIQFPKLPD